MEFELDLGKDGERLAYLKPVDVAKLPYELREQAGDLDVIYSVHNAEGKQLALIADQNLAHQLAVEYEVALHSVH